MSEFRHYRRRQIAELRPYAYDEDISGMVAVSDVDRAAGSPRDGDMIERHPENHNDQWLVSRVDFERNFESEPVETRPAEPWSLGLDTSGSWAY